MKILKLFGKLLFWLAGLFTALIISFYFTKDDAENLWNWFTSQLNSLSWTLFVIVLFLIIYITIKRYFDNKKDYNLDPEILIKKKRYEEEMKLDQRRYDMIIENGYREVFLDILARVHNSDVDYSDIDPIALKFFKSHGFIYKEENSPFYKIEDKSNRVYRILMMKTSENSIDKNNNTQTLTQNTKEDEIVNKIVKVIQKDKNLRIDYHKVVAKIYDGSVDYSDIDKSHMNYFFQNRLIHAGTRTLFGEYDTNVLTQRGKKVCDELI